MKLTNAQYCALCSLRDHGPSKGVETSGPPAMDGTRKIKLECHLMTHPTLRQLEALGFVSVYRGEVRRAVNAVGKRGIPRRDIAISITETGRAALSTDEVK